MTNKTEIEGIINKILEEEKDQFDDKDIFFVNCKISGDNRISVFIDSLKNVSIKDCVKLSRIIESKFDREKEDFELIVSSAGLDQPFLVLDQYKKNIGKQIKIKDSEGKNFKGELISVSDSGIRLKKNIKTSKNKKTPEQGEEINMKFDQIKEAKVVITF